MNKNFKKIEIEGVNLKFDYYINEDGLIYNKDSDKYINYCRKYNKKMRRCRKVASLRTNEYKIDVVGHILVAMVFNNSNKYSDFSRRVAFKDGNRFNIKLSNLEVVSSEEFSKISWGGKCDRSERLDAQIVKSICSMLESGRDVNYIQDLIFGTTYASCIRDYKRILNIKNRKTYSHISKGFEF